MWNESNVISYSLGELLLGKTLSNKSQSLLIFYLNFYHTDSFWFEIIYFDSFPKRAYILEYSLLSFWRQQFTWHWYQLQDTEREIKKKDFWRLSDVWGPPRIVTVDDHRNALSSSNSNDSFLYTTLHVAFLMSVVLLSSKYQCF